jgi:hypothetical protein
MNAETFRKFFEKHAAEFREGPKTYVQGEHNMVQWQAYQEYLGIYEVCCSLYYFFAIWLFV